MSDCGTEIEGRVHSKEETLLRYSACKTTSPLAAQQIFSPVPGYVHIRGRTPDPCPTVPDGFEQNIMSSVSNRIQSAVGENAVWKQRGSCCCLLKRKVSGDRLSQKQNPRHIFSKKRIRSLFEVSDWKNMTCFDDVTEELWLYARCFRGKTHSVRQKSCDLPWHPTKRSKMNPPACIDTTW